MTLSAAPDYHPRPFHEIFSLTLRSMNSSWLWDYLAVKIPLTLKKLKITTNYDFSCGTSLPWLPPPSTRFSHRPWQAWTLLDSEIFSWQKYLHNYHKLWLCLLCLITLTPPPSMRFSRWPWEAWTLLDGEIISWSKSHQPWKTWSLLYFSHSPKIYNPWQVSRGVGVRPFVAGCFTNPEKLRIT